MEQGKYNKLMDAWVEEEKKYHQECIRINERLLRAIKSLRGKEFCDELDQLMKDAEVKDIFEIVKNPKGKRQDCDYKLIGSEWVDQYTAGDSGDSFYGTITILIKPGKYLEMPYSM